MMQLSRQALQHISSEAVSVPPRFVFDLPEKVLQFGTGVLLRGLCDYFISAANEKNIFNGRIVVVKSTSRGSTDAFSLQDNLYTLCIRGIKNGKEITKNYIASSISRVLSAGEQWQQIIDCAHNRELRVIISNTTEVGISLVKESVLEKTPASFPGKLLAFLYERYKFFNAEHGTGFVIIPTELISNNGKQLFNIVEQLAVHNKLGQEFLAWLKTENHFCNSLVDRIVTGKPDAAKQKLIQEELGYEDQLMSVCEVYRLWAIEGNSEVKAILSFGEADPGVVIQPDIESFKALKLHLLNGTHTLTCGLAYLYGADLVRLAMEDAALTKYISHVMMNEIATAIPYPLNEQEIREFSLKVLDRFRNPYIDHLWLNITVQYSAKMRMRNVPVLLRYHAVYGKAPRYMSAGFAAYLLFMKAVKKEKEDYYGQRYTEFYLINDDKASYFYTLWQQTADVKDLVSVVLRNTELWGSDLSLLEGFEEEVRKQLESIMTNGMAVTLTRLAD